MIRTRPRSTARPLIAMVLLAVGPVLAGGTLEFVNEADTPVQVGSAHRLQLRRRTQERHQENLLDRGLWALATTRADRRTPIRLNDGTVLLEPGQSILLLDVNSPLNYLEITEVTSTEWAETGRKVVGALTFRADQANVNLLDTEGLAETPQVVDNRLHFKWHDPESRYTAAGVSGSRAKEEGLQELGQYVEYLGEAPEVF